MCGIVGYIGSSDAVSILLEALKMLEYRGYDSSGIAIMVNGNGGRTLDVQKSPGQISFLESKLKRHASNIGIAHTRWATHGVPNEVNAHPHVDGDGAVAVIHNGIIDNHLKLKEELRGKGHVFRTQTDSEVIPHLIAEEYSTSGGSLLEAVRKAARRLQGSYAIVVLHKEHPDLLVCAREKSPMVLGKGVKESFVASDVTALLRYTNSFLFMEDGDIATISRAGIKVERLDGGKAERAWKQVDWSLDDAEKGGFKHYMIKEIFEQPRSLHQTLSGWRSEEETIPRGLAQSRKVRIIACGTSYHAGLVGKYLFERYTGIPTEVSMASEYRFADPVKEDPLMLFITQSGETLDTIMAAREAKKRGSRTLSITNVLGSTITRETDLTLYLRSGPEIGVAASKTFTSQLLLMYLLSSYLGYNVGHMTRDEYRSVQEGLKTTIRAVDGVLSDISPIMDQAAWFKGAENAFYLGRYINYPTALEGALKMKEISYIHCEAYPAGELKHGPLALLTERTPVVVIVTNDHTYEKVLGNIGECAARGSPILALVPEGDTEVSKYTDRTIPYPRVPPILSPIPVSVILQLLAYHVADMRECPIDKPRNLAKSVTVE